MNPAKSLDHRRPQVPRTCFSFSVFVFGLLVEAVARDVQITVLHTSDVAGHVLSLPHHAKREYVGGMLRCASKISEIRASFEHVVLLDCGQFEPGSAESVLTKGLLPKKVLEYLDYDARLLSHDELFRRAGAIETTGPGAFIPVIAANIDGDPTGWIRKNRILRYWVDDIAGVRIAVTGVIEPSGGPRGFESSAAALKILPVVQALSDTLKAIRRSSPDVYILLCYFAEAAADGSVLRRAAELARRFPDFDVILMAGSREVLRSYRIRDTILAQAGNDARWLGRIDLWYDTVGQRIERMESDVLPIDASVPEELGLRSRLGASLGRIRYQLEEIIGYSTMPIDGSQRWPGQSAMQELVSLCMGRGEDIVLIGREQGGMLAKGSVRYADILRAVPDILEWAEVHITPPELREILEENLKQLGSRSFFGSYGILYHAYPDARTGDRVRDLRLSDGSPPHGRRRLRIRFPATVLNSEHDLVNRSKFRAIANRPKSRLSTSVIDTRKQAVKYIRGHSPVSVKPRRAMTLHPDEF